MKLIRKLVSVLSLAYLCIAPSVSNSQALIPGQQYTTGNVVTDTPYGGPSSWVNGIYQESLTCWAWGYPGYCGPNAIVRPGNNINFSFGQTDLYQSQAIANILPNSGTGLRVNGYNFSFTAKNGNGWDNGSTDSLYAYVHLTNQNNNVVHFKAYDLNFKFDWSSFHYSETFNTPYASSDLKNVTYGFVGRDNNGWAGPYGPEIYNISFSLKYSVDPCSVNVLSSPSCPGYLQELAKMTTPATTTPTVVTAPVIIESSTPSTPTITASVPSASTIAPATNISTLTTSVARTGETSSKSSGPSLSTVLNIVRSEQNKVSAVEKSTVQQAVNEATSSAQAAQQQAESVAATLTQQSIASSNESSGSKTNVTNQTTSQSSVLMTGPAPGSTSVVSVIQIGPKTTSESNQTSFSSISTESLVQPRPVMSTEIATSISPVIESNTPTPPVIAAYTPTQNNQSQQMYSIAPLLPPSQGLKPTERAPEPEVNLSQNEIRFGERNLILEQTSKQEIKAPETSAQSNTSTVNRETKDNDAAGAVTIAAIAKQPPGFELYMSAIKDNVFYAPKEIYKNQNVVDNQKAIRQLGGRSDRLHEQMVGEQYKNR